ncbi:MAG TPA: response regulator [Verrucomicrobiales bacterium]|nr:response regulator [Verrucomicrobiales bacterium]
MSARKSIEILLVEDNPGDVRLAREAFRDAAVDGRLTWVTDGDAALAFLRREGVHAGASRPDVVLLDLKLPRKDGREFLAELRGDAALRDIPVLVLTSSSSDEDRLRVTELRADAFLTKPFDLDAFVEIARSVDRFCRSTSPSGAPGPFRHPSAACVG